MFELVSKIVWNKKEVDMSKKYDLFFKDGSVLRGCELLIDNYDETVCFKHTIIEQFYEALRIDSGEMGDFLLDVKENKPSE